MLVDMMMRWIGRDGGMRMNAILLVGPEERGRGKDRRRGRPTRWARCWELGRVDRGGREQLK